MTWRSKHLGQRPLGALAGRSMPQFGQRSESAIDGSPGRISLLLPSCNENVAEPIGGFSEILQAFASWCAKLSEIGGRDKVLRAPEVHALVEVISQ